jgi:cytochrome P450
MTTAPMAQTLRQLQDLPGPSGWPLLGNLPQIEPARFLLQLGAWARQYGRFFKLRMANRLLLLAVDHQAVASVLRDRPEGFRRTDRLEAVGLEMGLKAGLFGVNGDAWRRQRRMVMAAFDPSFSGTWTDLPQAVHAHDLRRALLALLQAAVGPPNSSVRWRR